MLKNLINKLKRRGSKKSLAAFSMIELLVTVVLISSVLVYIQRAMDETTILHKYATLYQEAINTLRIAMLENGGRTDNLGQISRKYSKKSIKIVLSLASYKKNLIGIRYRAFFKIGIRKKVVSFVKYYFRAPLNPGSSGASSNPLDDEAIEERDELDNENIR
jgi:predicted PurR-regulated permease PerM